MPQDASDLSLNCPMPITDPSRILLGHGGGGRLSRELYEKVFRPAFVNDALEAEHDGALLRVGRERLAFTTDSYVISPIFFPGGDIGSLAVHGTVNDLAMCGAQPLYLSAGFILEEGFETEKLRRIVSSMKKAAENAGVLLVTGDTKVVHRGGADQIFINTAGIGKVDTDLRIEPASVRAGDRILLSGDLGRHGIAIMGVREGLSFESDILSDSASVAAPALDLLRSGVGVRCMRDLTRGGLTSALNEIAGKAGLRIRVEEEKIPVGEPVRGACELLGLDPYYVANEGRFIVFVPPKDEARSLAILKKHAVSSGAACIGEVEVPGASGGPVVVLKSAIGTHRILDMISGEQLPRIC